MSGNINVWGRGLLIGGLLLGAQAQLAQAEPEPTVIDQAGGAVQDKAQEKIDRQTDRVTGKTEQSADQATDRAVDKVLDRALTKIFGK